MKLLFVLPLLAVATPVQAHWPGDGNKNKSLKAAKAHKTPAHRSVRYTIEPRRIVGRQGDCPRERDGYCRSVEDWWDYQNNRS